MNDSHFDLIVIGTGPSASTVAKKTRSEGKRVAILESREFGGTCALRGCNPKKVYANAADLYDRAWGAKGKLIEFDGVRIDWQKLHAFKREFTQPVIEKSEPSYAELGIATFHGHASFGDWNTVLVNGESLTAERIFIGVGAAPRPLDLPGETRAIRSDDFLELVEMPERVTFIGGGYVSMEFACVAARFGASVTVLQRGQQVLTPFDPDLVAQLVQYSAQHGIQTHTSSTVTAIEDASDGRSVIVQYEKSDQSRSVEADLVVHGAGRVPNLDGMNLELGGIDSGDKGIRVDDCMRSVSNPIVYAAGDCADTGKPRLTPTANEEARIVVKNLFAENPSAQPQYGVIPQVAFTVPSIAAIGMSQQDAEASYNVDVRHDNTSSWGSVRKTGQRCAGYKILVDKDTDKILGAHLLGPASEETINLFALAMKYGLTATDIKATLFAFPTFASDVRRMV